LHITADTLACIGSGQCALALPEVFDQDEDGVVVLLDDQPADEFRSRVYEVVGRCPVLAIAATEP
jgi:ferredoxin